MATQQLQQGATGKQVGLVSSTSGGEFGEILVSELQPRFYEWTYRGNVFFNGLAATTSIANATFTTGTLGATETPIAGVWNPSTSTVNLVILQASINVIITALTATGGQPYVWAVSTGNAAISTGTAPWNRKTLTQAGSQAKGMSGIALTGLTNNMVVAAGSALVGGPVINASETYTVAGTPFAGTPSIENFDGSLIVPPGGVLSLLATTTPVALSAVSSIMWMEVPI